MWTEYEYVLSEQQSMCDFQMQNMSPTLFILNMAIIFY